MSTLTHTAPSPHAPTDDDASFEEEARALTARWWPRLGLAIMAAALLWWPLDALLYPDEPEAVAALSAFRLQLVIVNLILILVLPRIAFAQRHAHAAAALSAALNLALGGWAFAALAEDTMPSIAYGFVAPQFSILLLVPLLHRVFIATGLSVAFVGAWVVSPLNTVGGSFPPAALSYLVFVTAVAIFLGHGMYMLFRRNFHLRRHNDRQRDALASLAASLEARVEEQTQAIVQLHTRARELRTRERREVLLNLHDSLGQELLSMRLLVGVGRKLHTEGPVVETLTELEGQVARLQQSLKDTLRSLQPAALDDVGLVESLAETLDELTRRAGVAFSLDAGHVREPLPRAVATACYYIALEAVSNALRHGHPRRIEVVLRSESAALILTVSDDGEGIRSAQIGAGMGTRGILDRVAEVGGQAEWNTTAPGTRLHVALPLGCAP